MRYIENIDGGWPLDPYMAYLEENASRFPPGVREFATAPWHYDITHHQCPHDSWVQQFLIRELVAGERKEIRNVEIEADFLGPYHDGHFTLTYTGVTSFTCEDRIGNGLVRGHGDWMVDELVLLDTGAVLHEIQFVDGLDDEMVWKITCGDVLYRWYPRAS